MKSNVLLWQRGNAELYRQKESQKESREGARAAAQADRSIAAGLGASEGKADDGGCAWVRRERSTMSNCEVVSLPELDVEYHQVKDVLRCVLHTILFNRALGLVRPREVDLALFDITYVVSTPNEAEAQRGVRLLCSVRASDDF